MPAASAGITLNQLADKDASLNDSLNASLGDESNAS